MKKIALIVFLFLPFYSFSQQLSYTIRIEDSNIGKLLVSKSVENGFERIVAESEIKVNLFIQIDFTYKLSSTYKNGLLYYSSLQTYINGCDHSNSTIEKSGNHYLITSDKHIKKFNDEINYSGSRLYFQEPIDISYEFSEFDNIRKSIKKVKPHNYEIINPHNGHISEYFYKGGILQKAVIHHTLITFTIEKD